MIVLFDYSTIFIFSYKIDIALRLVFILYLLFSSLSFFRTNTFEPMVFREQSLYLHNFTEYVIVDLYLYQKSFLHLNKIK